MSKCHSGFVHTIPQIELIKNGVNTNKIYIQIHTYFVLQRRNRFINASLVIGIKKLICG